MLMKSRAVAGRRRRATLGHPAQRRQILALRFTFNGKEGTLTLGNFPTVSCQLARDKAEDARRLLAPGVHPIQQRREAHRAHQVPQFERLARD